jgi:DNA-3-methyladenine glycosylase II
MSRTLQPRSPSQPRSLTIETLAQGVAFLSDVDQDLARVNAELGPPPMWARKPGFPTLVHVILEQQVSLASAKAALAKLKEATLTVTPEKFLKLNDRELKKIGFSRQKTSYCRGLALSILNNEIDLDALDSMDDPSARSMLMKVEGIGPWTADSYLLMALLRPDIWPSGDLALASAIRELKGLSSRPDSETLDRIALPWRPWRAVAARLLWHYYLSKRNSTGRPAA